MKSCSELPHAAVSHSLVDVAEECKLSVVKGKLGLTQNDLFSTLLQIRFKTNTEGQTSRYVVYWAPLQGSSCSIDSVCLSLSSIAQCPTPALKKQKSDCVAVVLNIVMTLVGFADSRAAL